MDESIPHASWASDQHHLCIPSQHKQQTSLWATLTLGARKKNTIKTMNIVECDGTDKG